jgi:hypothetical protein
MAHPQSLGLSAFFDYTAGVRTRIHRFLLLLLMLALPVQAFASAAMLGCALPQQDAVQTMAMADEMMAGCHEPEQSPPTSHNCKHCTACALASALPIPAADTASGMPERENYASHPAAFFSGFVPEGPERPPRPTSA